jgi:N-acyl homoserine lactone hydrolase
MNKRLLGLAGVIFLGLSFCVIGWAQGNKKSAPTSELYSRQWLLGVTTPDNPQALPTSVQRLYILDCGQGVMPNIESWTVGRNRGKSVSVPTVCLLVKDTQGWFLYDTGLPDYVASMPDGWQPGQGGTGFHWSMDKTLMSQLDQLGVKPSDLMGIGLGSDDPTCVGNLELFPNTTVYMSKLEDATMTSRVPGTPPGDPVPGFSPKHPVQLFDEDWDVFNDNSVIMVGLPGHDPGVSGLLIHLQQTGWVLWTDDAVHVPQEFYTGEVPQWSGHSPEARVQMLLSQERIRDLMNYYQAKMIVKFDPDQYKGLKLAPEYYQ